MNVVIYGAGGLGREIYDTLTFIHAKTGGFNVLGFVDDVKAVGTRVNGVEVLGSASFFRDMGRETGVVLGFADPFARKKAYYLYKDSFHFPNVIHPSALISPFATVGQAVLVQANGIVAANAMVGNGVMMNAHSGVGHDAQVGAFCSIMSYCDLAGNAVLGDLSFVGTGAKILPGIHIAPENYICAGSVVFKNVLTKSKLMGNPAKIIG